MFCKLLNISKKNRNGNVTALPFKSRCFYGLGQVILNLREVISPGLRGRCVG